jgi:hypothetical protein
MSQTWVTSELDTWGVKPKYHHILKLFEVLLNPPLDVDLEAIDGLSKYLCNLCTQLVKSTDNGIHTVVSHCWWVIHGILAFPCLCIHHSDIPIGLCHHSSKNVKWKSLLSHLEGSQRRLINWCPTIQFPPETKTMPKNHPILKSMLHMFFNPEPLLRLCMSHIEGMYMYHEY